MAEIFRKNWLKFILGWALCFLIRRAASPLPNVEPVMMTTMPFGKTYGKFAGLFFAALSIIFYDAVTSGFGLWTWITAAAYGLIGFAAGVYFAKRPSTPFRYCGFAVVATLFYDAVTGLTIGPIFYAQPFAEALIGQAPFTLLHLLSNIVLALLVSPVIERWVTGNAALEIPLYGRRLGQSS